MRKAIAKLREYSWPWPLHSIRNQILISMLAMFALATVAAALIAINNGRRAVDVEIHASTDFAERYLRELVRRVSADGRIDDLEKIVSKELINLRHARAYIQNFGSEPKQIRPTMPAGDASDPTAPRWFKALMMPVDGDGQTRLILTGQDSKTLIVRGDPEDEIEEKWDELSELAIVWICVIAALAIGFHFVLKWILDPLNSLSAGLTALTAGRSEQRVLVPNVHEVAELAREFNTLAASLDQVRSENRHLYRQIVDVQEEERRHIARELHDEAGPCLFGITTNAESIETISSRLPDHERDLLNRRTREILAAAVRLKHMNRALLRRLHPVSLGKIPVSSLLTELLEDIRRRNPGVSVKSSLVVTSGSFGERIDLTIYRCIQEALTNAIRHGHAKNIAVSASQSTSDTGDFLPRIELQIRDDGIGLRPETELGFGLAAMRERVLAAKGSLQLKSGPTEPGTLLSVTIPLTREYMQPSPFKQQETARPTS